MASSASTYPRTGTFLVSIVGLGIAAAVGFSLHLDATDRKERRAVEVAVGETTEALRASLKRVPPEVLAQVESHMASTKRWRNTEVADATEHYLLGAREILRRRAEADRLQSQAAASRAALAAHMARAASRGAGWAGEATELKRQVERDHFDLEVQLRTLAALLQSMPEAGRRLAAHVDPALLMDEALASSAHRATLDEAKRARNELEKARDLLR